jgi:hypothetical protein
VVCVAFIVALDDVIIQVGQARECADLGERVLGKLGHLLDNGRRWFKETLGRRLWCEGTISHGMTTGVLHPTSVS